MRFDTIVKFYDATGRQKLNPVTGNFEQEHRLVAEKLAHVSEIGLEKQKAIFGNVTVDARVITLRNVQKKKFDQIRMNDKPYEVVRERVFKNKHSFVVRG